MVLFAYVSYFKMIIITIFQFSYSLNLSLQVELYCINIVPILILCLKYLLINY